MFNIEVNKKEILISKELTILQAIEKTELKVPRFCFHEKLSIAGNCRMCIVEIDKVNKPVVSCAMNLTDNMQIFTNTILVKKARESILELLLINHPLDCPICDQGGECDLQDQTFLFGNDKSRFYEFKRSVSDKNISSIIKTIMTRCIHCTRCVRFLNEIAGSSDLGVTGRGNIMEIGTYIENSINSEISGNIIDLCPVGALTSKTYSFITRSWELKNIETIDIMDSLGSNILINIRGINILRVLPRINENLNEEWITDKIRFCLDGILSQRLSFPMYQIKYLFNFKFNNLSIFEKFNFKNFNKIICSWKVAFIIFKEQLFYNFVYENKLVITGNQINNESLNLLKFFFFKFNFNFISNQYNSIIKNNLDFQSNYYFNNSLKYLEKIDTCLLIGVNLRLENPLVNIRLRKSFLLNNSLIASIGPSINSIYSLQKLGNSLKNILLILNGKHFFNNYLIKSNNSIIILGNYLNNFNYLFNRLHEIYNHIKIFNIYPFISSLSTFEYGINSLNYEIKNNNNFYYLFHTDEITFNNNNKNFIVYQGSHYDRNCLIADLIFPSNSFLEENNSFLNLLGLLNYNKKSLDLLSFYEYENRISYNIIDNLISFLLLKNISNYQIIIKDLNLSKLNLNNYLKIRINNSVLNNIFSSYYKTDSITRSSLIMSKISQNNLKKNLNINFV